jgi:hypothetical protein
MHRARLLVSAILLTSCVRIGEATSDEKKQLDAWSKLVTEKDRAEVRRAADAHTDWMEKKKVQWMTQQYRARYNRAQEKKEKAATQATTKG